MDSHRFALEVESESCCARNQYYGHETDIYGSKKEDDDSSYSMDSSELSSAGNDSAGNDSDSDLDLGSVDSDDSDYL